MKNLKKFIGDKTFYKTVFAIILPIMIQQLFLSLAGYIDNIMINSYGGTAEAYNGVNAANRLMFVCNFVWMGAGATASIFISQFFGAGEKDKANEALRLGIIVAALFGIITFVVVELFGDSVVNSYVQSEVSRQAGYDYLDYIKHGTLITSFIMMVSSAFRSVKKPGIALISAICGIFVNIILNYCLIFGHFGFNEMGAGGAALATVLSRVVELTISVIFLFFGKDSYFKGVFKKLHISKPLVVDFIKRGTPLICNEILWSLGLVLLAMFYTYKNDVWYNAYGYSQNITELFNIVFAGLGNGTAIFIGSSLGRGDFDQAIKESYQFKGLGIMMGIIVGVLMLITSPFIVNMFNPTPEVRQLTISLLTVSGIFTGVYCYNSVCFFILRSGGDSIRAFILDQSPTYLFSLPVAILLGINAKAWGISIITIFVVSHIGDIIKIFISNIFVAQRKWLVNLTVNK